MRFEPTRIPDVLLLVPRIHGDDRGFFMEVYNARTFAQAGLDAVFVQDNHSQSRRGTLRGLHYQVVHPQGKLVRVVEGEVFDVAVDLRKSSPTFGRWVGERLSAENRHQLWVPSGFAHGFYALSATASVVYKCTDFYHAEHERCLRWDDPDVGVEWPLIEGVEVLMSARDKAGVGLAHADLYP